MNNMYKTRKEKGITQDELSELTGIHQVTISVIETGKFKPNKQTRGRIEKVLGKIDWIETEKIQLQSSSYYIAERLVKELVSMTITMKDKEKTDIKKLIHKYFN